MLFHGYSYLFMSRIKHICCQWSCQGEKHINTTAGHSFLKCSTRYNKPVRNNNNKANKCRYWMQIGQQVTSNLSNNNLPPLIALLFSDKVCKMKNKFKEYAMSNGTAWVIHLCCYRHYFLWKPFYFFYFFLALTATKTM